MELVSGVVFIGAVIAGVTQAIKLLAPTVNGAVTIAVAALLGLLVAVFDVQLGVVALTPAQGILIGLGTSGVVTVAEKV